MVTIRDLPVEILLQIIEENLLQTKYNPVIGRDASWLPPYRLMRQQPAIPTLELFECLPHEEAEEDGEYTSSIKALRLVNKAFKALAEPYLFSEVNMLQDWSALRTEMLLNYLVGPHWQHIQVMRTYTDRPQPTYDRDGRLIEQLSNIHAKSVAEILMHCHNLRALALYYTSYRNDLAYISTVVVSLLENGRLTSLGIYSPAVVAGGWEVRGLTADMCGPMGLINCISRSEKACNALKTLDIATEWMPKEIYSLLQSSRFPNLESLAVRYSFRHEILWDIDPAQRNQWRPSANLVRLQLISCQTAYAPDMPLLVAQFENLEELLISMCGYNGDLRTLPREPGWSRLPSALCQNRRPLRLFTIEHMDEWEIRELGAIPTTTLVSANVNRRHLIGAFESDPEIFPGLALVRVLPDRRVVLVVGEESDSEWSGDEAAERDAEDAYIKETKKMLDELCAKRRVEVRRDAQRTVDCYCCEY